MHRQTTWYLAAWRAALVVLWAAMVEAGGRPAVTITGLDSSAGLSGSVEFGVQFQGEVGEVAYVELLVDGKAQVVRGSEPWVFHWDTTRGEEGEHTVQVVAWRREGDPLRSQVQKVQVRPAVPKPINRIEEGAPAPCYDSVAIWSPDSKFVAFNRGFYLHELDDVSRALAEGLQAHRRWQAQHPVVDHGVYVASADGKQARRILTSTHDLAWSVEDWSRDGRWLLVSGEPNTAYRVDPASGAKVQLNRERELAWADGRWVGAAFEPQTWSPDGRKILGHYSVYEKEDGWKITTGLAFLSAEGGDPAWVVAEERASFVFQELSPDGSHIAFTRSPRDGGLNRPIGVFVVSALGGQPKRIASGSGTMRGIKWLPDGTSLGIVDETGVRVVEVSSQRSRKIVDGPCFTCLWSRDGKWFAYVAGQENARSLFLMPSKGGDPVVLDEGHIVNARWAPDSLKIACATRGGRIWVYSLATRLWANVSPERAAQPAPENTVHRSGVPTPINRIEEGVRAPSSGGGGIWSPDSKFIAFDRGFYLHELEDASRALAEGLQAHRRWQAQHPVVDHGVYVASADGKQARRILTSTHDLAWSVEDWSPDGRWLLVSGETNTSYRVDPATGAKQRLSRVPDMDMWAGRHWGTGLLVTRHFRPRSWSRDGRSILGDYTVTRGEMDSTEDPEMLRGLALLSAEGRTPGLPRTDLDRFDLLAGGREEIPTWVVADERALVLRVEFSPDGSQIAFTRSPRDPGPNSLVEVLVVSARGGQPKQIAASSRGMRSIEWLPDGTRVGIADQTGIRVIEVGSLKESKIAEGPCFSCAWSPDGNWLAYHAGVEDARSLLLIPSTGGDVVLLDKGHTVNARWSPDSLKIACWSKGEHIYVYSLATRLWTKVSP